MLDKLMDRLMMFPERLSMLIFSTAVSAREESMHAIDVLAVRVISGTVHQNRVLMFKR